MNLEVGRDAVEGGFQVGTNGLYGADDDDGDKSGNQAILDGRDAAFIPQESSNKRKHRHLNLSNYVIPTNELTVG